MSHMGKLQQNDTYDFTHGKILRKINLHDVMHK